MQLPERTALFNVVHTAEWRGWIFVYDSLVEIDADKLAAALLKAGKEKVPDYAFDCHTLNGKRAGKTKADFFREERGRASPSCCSAALIRMRLAASMQSARRVA